MEGLERLEIQTLELNNASISAVFDYLKTRKDLYENFKNEEKTMKQMYEFMYNKASKHKQDNVAMISDQLVYMWAVMYFTRSNEDLGIKEKKVMPPTSKEVIEKIEKKNDKSEEKDSEKNALTDNQINLFQEVQK